MKSVIRKALLFLLLLTLFSLPALPTQAAVTPTASCPQGQNCVYLPFAARPPAAPAGRIYAQNLWNTVYNVPTPDIGWTGNLATCTPGTTSQAWRNAVLRRINYFRSMAGLPSATLYDSYNQESQAAALIMSAQNDLNHTPPSTWACWTQLGYNGASSANLYGGVNGPDAITGYMDDYGLDVMGHRRWVLYPQTQQFGTGDTPGAPNHWKSNALHVFDTPNLFGPRPAVRDGFVAWPPPVYVPYQVTFAYWSLSYPDADFSAAAVSVTSGGVPLSVTRYPQQDGYGENTLVWKINSVNGGWPRPAADTPYQVAVTNVKVGTQTLNFNYTVTVFDPVQ